MVIIIRRLVKDYGSLDNRLSPHRIKAHLPLAQSKCFVNNPRYIDPLTICVCKHPLATGPPYPHFIRLTKIINGSWKFVCLTERAENMNLLLEDFVR